METILFQNGVYTLIKHSLTDAQIEELSKDKSFVVSNSLNRSGGGLRTFHFYGGRVKIKVFGCYGNQSQFQFFVDGFEISKMESVDCGILDKITAYLNQIEQLGVDTFLANYKAAIIAEKEELSAMCDKLAAELQLRENEEKEKTLSRLRRKIEDLIGLLFLLTINMNAGLDNQAYIDAYAESENVISQYIENAE